MKYLVTFMFALSASHCLVSDNNLGTIIFSSVLYRHGDRAPLSLYPNDPYNDVARYWPRGYGQLSKIGEEQHYQLGSFLRQRYSDLLPLTYNTNDTYVRSTDVDRTLVSALCNLAGLYPSTGTTEGQSNIKFQAIPVHTETKGQDRLLQSQYSCPKYVNIMSHLLQSHEYHCLLNETAEVQEKVAAFAGFATFNSGIYDILFVEELYNLTLTNWVRDFYPNPLKNIYLLEDFVGAAGTTELQRLSAGPLIKEIIENIQNKVASTLIPNRKLYVYSVHDTNVVNTLQALKIFNGILVPYASAVLFELRELNSNYFITVSYKNSTDTDPYLLQLPGCDSLCPLEKFIELTKDVIPDDFDRECVEEVQPGTQYTFQIPSSAILPEWEHCFQRPRSDDGVFHYLSFTTHRK